MLTDIFRILCERCFRIIHKNKAVLPRQEIPLIFMQVWVNCKMRQGSYAIHSPFISVSSFPHSGFPIFRPFTRIGINASC